jgi:hypothetical protein
MAPWKENDEELRKDVAVGHIEVMLQGRNIHVAVELMSITVLAASLDLSHNFQY